MEKAKKNLLIIFTRNIVLGKCKTRLAKTIGAEKALEIYRFLVQHTAEISKAVEADKWVSYSEQPEHRDYFDSASYKKFAQEGTDLGERMERAFAAGFERGYSNIVIIGSDIYELDEKDLNTAFRSLEQHEYVIGPARDGGYYLLGMKEHSPELFKAKSWGTDRVFNDTMNDLENRDVKLLPVRNDIDVFEDISGLAEFQRFLMN